MKNMKVWNGILIFLFIGCLINVWGAGNYPQPQICDRVCWSARPPQCAITQEPAVNRAIIHHTEADSHYDVASLEDTKVKVRSIQNYHMDTMGWCDIAYHFLIDKLGNCVEGIEGSISSYPTGMRLSYATNTVSFSCLGDFGTKKNNQPTVIMRERMYDLIAWKIPDPFTALGSGNYETTPDVGWLCSHRDIVSTTCPGDLLYTYVGTDFYNAESRHEVNDRINGITHPTDVVTVVTAEFIEKGGILTVEAVSNKQPDAVLTFEGVGALPWDLLLQNYRYYARKATNPVTVTVTSSLGGSATVDVTVK
jgi:hypothetical protein